ncbi:response regulator, partial [Cyclobacteriaceae bacterium]|nr:response regulator [Cyclobacteriaceae bacterium]
NIPKINGFDCIKTIRESKSNTELPVLAVTGNANNLSKEEYIAQGFNDLVLKPINFDNFITQVSNWIK